MENKEKISVNKVSVNQALKKEMPEEQFNVYVAKNKIRTPDFVMFYQKAGNDLLDDKMSYAAYKIFLFFMCEVGYENFVPVRVARIMERLSISRATVLKALKELKDCNYLRTIKDCNDARINNYQINPYIAWKGKVRKRQKALKSMKGQLNLFEPNKDF